jgi:uncharacterized membrane protein YdjX (TVP38/TMEM64 family)
MGLAALIGSLVPAVLYALTGAAVANFQSTSLMFGIVLVVTGLFSLAGRLLERYVKARKERGVTEQAVILDRRNQPSS